MSFVAPLAAPPTHTHPSPSHTHTPPSHHPTHPPTHLSTHPHLMQTNAVVGILGDEADPAVSVMKVEHAPAETYAGGLGVRGRGLVGRERGAGRAVASHTHTRMGDLCVMESMEAPS